MARLAWFSPMPPTRSGVADCSAQLVSGLRRRHEIDVFVDRAAHPDAGTGSIPLRSAHDFVWLNQHCPYDLVVYQLGNSRVHDYIWPYLFRYPGLVVLHDTRLHHARARCLLEQRRIDDYRAEFIYNHPQTSPDPSELAVMGLGGTLHYLWPMVRAVVESARIVAVHNRRVADDLRASHPSARVEVIALGQGWPLSPEQMNRACAAVRMRHHVPLEAPVFGCFGNLTREKRVPQVLSALAAITGSVPDARLVLVGGLADDYDLEADIRALEVADRVIVSGYVEREAELTAYIAATDVCLNLRWPSAGETSGPWLRSLAAGKPTVITDLVQTVDVPSLDPRSWQTRYTSTDADGERPAAVCVAIDILDEDHSLRLAMRRLAVDARLRDALGREARRYWERRHTVEGMVRAYERLIGEAIHTPHQPPLAPPPHLRAEGTELARALLAPFDVTTDAVPGL